MEFFWYWRQVFGVFVVVIPDFFFPNQNCIDEIETVISAKLQLMGIVGIGIAGLTVRVPEHTFCAL